MGEGPVARRPYFCDENILPHPVQSERHQVVHHVVAIGDRVKHLVDQPLLGVERHAALAEMGFLGGRGHQKLRNGATLARAGGAGQRGGETKSSSFETAAAQPPQDEDFIGFSPREPSS